MVKYLNKDSGFKDWAEKKGGEKKASNFFLWLIIFLLFWWLLAGFFAPKDKIKNDVNSESVQQDVSVAPVSVLNNEKIALNVQGLRLSDIELKNYKQDLKQDTKVSLLSGDKEFIEVGVLASGTAAPNYNTVWKNSDGKMVWKNSDGIQYIRTIELDNYLITIKDEINNNSKKDISFSHYANILRAEEEKTVSVKTGAVSYVNSDVEYNAWKKLDKKSYTYQTVNGFTGFSDQYWETIVSLQSPDQTVRIKKLDSRYQADTTSGQINVSAGKTAVLETRIYAGPKEQNILSSVGGKITGIEETIDYGWFWFLAQPMSAVLNFLNGLVLNYGLAIILLTIGMRLLMWPLTRKSYTSMAAMQKMQPEMMRIQKLYANDKMRIQMEMMKLYQTHKTSPMSGCLPMLLQIPIFFALYKALLISVPMRHAEFLWIPDLSILDPYFILPIIMGATMWWQQHLQTPATKGADMDNPAAQMQKFMKWMPLLFTIMFAWMPAGLVLYWTISNLFGIGQIYIIKKQK